MTRFWKFVSPFFGSKNGDAEIRGWRIASGKRDVVLIFKSFGITKRLVKLWHPQPNYKNHLKNVLLVWVLVFLWISDPFFLFELSDWRAGLADKVSTTSSGNLLDANSSNRFIFSSFCSLNIVSFFCRFLFCSSLVCLFTSSWASSTERAVLLDLLKGTSSGASSESDPSFWLFVLSSAMAFPVKFQVQHLF